MENDEFAGKKIEPVLKFPERLPRRQRKPKDRYVLLNRIGVGGSGAVYRAEDLELDRIIAIKLLHPMLAQDERYIDCLKREVVVASQITHPNVVRVFDLSKLRSSPIVTMAYIHGVNLATILKQDGALAPPRIIHLLRQICSGLEEAHRRGVIHRDFKPQNLLIDYESKLFISDFGLSHIAGDMNRAIPNSDRPGALWYQSPEQFHALPLDGRSDIFSLGLIIYEMLTGTALEIDHGATERIALNKKTGLPVSLPDTVPARLAEIALRCLACNPDKRYASVSEILESLPRDLGSIACEAITENCPDASRTPIKLAWMPIRSSRRLVMNAVLSVTLLLGLGAWGYWTVYNSSASSSSEQIYREATLTLHNTDTPSIQKAAKLFQSSAELKPSAAAYEGLARAKIQLYQRGYDHHELVQARSALEKAEKLERESRSAALLHVELDIADGQGESALSRLNHVLAAEAPSDDVFRLRAKAYLLTGRSLQGLQSWQRAVNINPNYWVNHNGFGSALMAAGQSEKAQAAFHAVIRLNPSSSVGYANLGAAYVSSGEFAIAIPVTEKSLSIRPTAPQYNNLGTALYYTGSCHAAIQLFRKAVELNSHSELYFGNLAEAYRCTGDNVSAMAAYGSALQFAQEGHAKAPNNTRLTARLALLLAKIGRIDEGQRLLASALTSAPENPEIVYSGAVMCVVRKQYSEGAIAVKTALARGYPIKAAARDPELKPLWTDQDLKKRFQVELSRKPSTSAGDLW